MLKHLSFISQGSQSDHELDGFPVVLICARPVSSMLLCSLCLLGEQQRIRQGMQQFTEGGLMKQHNTFLWSNRTLFMVKNGRNLSRDISPASRLVDRPVIRKNILNVDRTAARLLETSPQPDEWQGQTKRLRMKWSCRVRGCLLLLALLRP